ncbi:MAG: matrixin family metalloprotease [Opitutaceae bacterium]|nr:matrixin family metalloprotease [Opitutaceae bacterium]
MRTIDQWCLRLAVLLGFWCAPFATAYDVDTDSSGIYVVVWKPGDIPMRLQLPAPPGVLIDGSTSYSTPVLNAMQQWNLQIGTVRLVGQVSAGTAYAAGNRINEIVMDAKADGEDFSDNTLAITLTYRNGNTRTEADIVFNTKYTWDSYRGAQRNSEDIQRVALHELGHVLSMEHPDKADPKQSVAAIMNSRISNQDTLTNDDISGARWLYGAPGAVPLNDNFANATVIASNTGMSGFTGATIGGSAQAGEPDHDTEKPSHSIWWRWTSPGDVTVTLDTLGSNFDTVLGVYTGSAVNALTKVASNDDKESGVIRTSTLSFNATTGTTYYFAVDGWDGSYGQVALAMALATAPPGAAPVITTQPASQLAAVGGAVTFSVAANNSPTAYQWRFNGVVIANATTSAYSINSVTVANAGDYAVTVTNAAGSVASHAATLTVYTPAVSTQVVTSGHDVSLAAPAQTGAYQWQVAATNSSTWTDLANNSTYGGVTSQTLTITSAGTGLNDNRYRYVVTSAGGTSTGAAIALTVGAAVIPHPVALVADGVGGLFVTDSSTHVVQQVDANLAVTVLAGSSGIAGHVDGRGTIARFNQPVGLMLYQNALLVADSANAVIRQVTLAGDVTDFSGAAMTTGQADGAATAARYRLPLGLGAGPGGVPSLTDALNHVVRRLATDGAVTTDAGAGGQPGYADGTGSAARFNYPVGIAADSAGTRYVSDMNNNVIRKVRPDGAVSTLAGTPMVSGWEDGPGVSSLFNQPRGLAVDAAGNVYVADTGNSAIRKITPDGQVSTLAGLPTVGGLKDGQGTDAWFNQPQGLAIDAQGNLYVADTGNAAIRKVTPAGVVTTLALTVGASSGGTGGGGSSGGGTTTPPTTGGSSGGGGGGGGGAPSLWFLFALAGGAVSRWWQRLRA